MDRRAGIHGLLLLFLLAGIVVLALIWDGRFPHSGPTFASSILPSPIATIAIAEPSGTPQHVGTPSPTMPPFPTVVFPTPDTPIPGAPIISEDEAIAVALAQNDYYAERLERGESSVTTRLTRHGDTAAGTTGDLSIHPTLPVWIVYLHVAPWAQRVGPEGGQIEVQYNAIWYESDAATGALVGGGRSFLPAATTPTPTPQPAL